MSIKMEYKFRAKNKDSGKWVCGCFVKSVNDRAYIVICATEDAINTRNELDFIYTEVIPETVGMFTGLTDIDSKEIYAGDIVEAWSQGEKAKGIVERRMDGLWIMYPAYQKGDFWGLCPNNRGETTVKIIGNIYD